MSAQEMHLRSRQNDFRLRLPFDELTNEDVRVLIPRLKIGRGDSIKWERHVDSDGLIRTVYFSVSNNKEAKPAIRGEDPSPKRKVGEKPTASSESFRESKTSQNSDSTRNVTNQDGPRTRSSRVSKSSTKQGKVQKAHQMLNELASQVNTRLRSRDQSGGKLKTIMRAPRSSNSNSPAGPRKVAQNQQQQSRPIAKQTDRFRSKPTKVATERKVRMFEDSSFDQDTLFSGDVEEPAQKRTASKGNQSRKRRTQTSDTEDDLYASVHEKVVALSVVYSLDPKVVIRRWLDLGSFEALLGDIAREYAKGPAN